jgi:hypothetical protein
MENDAKKEAFQIQKAACRKSDAVSRKMRDLIKRAKAGEDVDQEWKAVEAEMESCNEDLWAALEAVSSMKE